MDSVLAVVNALGSGITSIALVWAVLSPRVRDGIIIKAGLSVLALGFGSIALRAMDLDFTGDAEGMARSLVLVNGGIAVVILGYLVRRFMSGHELRRITDFAELDSRPHGR